MSKKRIRALPLLFLLAVAGVQATLIACSSDDSTSSGSSSDGGTTDATSHADGAPSTDGSTADVLLTKDSGKDTGITDGGSDADGDIDAALQTMQFWSPCVKPDGGAGKQADIAPAPGEDDFLLGVRLTPPSYPFTVYKIRYAVANQGSACRPDVAHRVELSVAPQPDASTAPANNPTIIETIQVPGVAPDAGPYDAGPPDSGAPKRIWLEHTLTTPITLTTGQDLFVSIQLAGIPGTQTLCVGFCFENTIADRNYWSQAASVPYNWATLDSIGFPINAEVEALGLPQ